MKNKISDLRNHLFAQLERLGDETLTPEELEHELKRSEGIRDISSQLTETAKVEVQFVRAVQATKGSEFLQLTEGIKGGGRDGD